MLAIVGFALSMPLSAYQIVGCPGDTDSQNPVGAIDSTNGGTHSKRNLHNWFYWAFIDPVFSTELFKVYTHHSYISWGYNVNNHSIPWIDKWGVGECQTPYGSCDSVYAIWPTEVCDRAGNDTCLFRRENQGHASFTYGVLFNSWMVSCLGTRINWDGSHVRNKWEGTCAGGAAQAMKAGAPPLRLTLGYGKNQVPASRYFDRAQMRSLSEACFKGTPDAVADCKQVAFRLYRALPPDAQRKLRPTACPALSPESLRLLHPGTRCERRANGGRS